MAIRGEDANGQLGREKAHPGKYDKVIGPPAQATHPQKRKRSNKGEPTQSTTNDTNGHMGKGENSPQGKETNKRKPRP